MTELLQAEIDEPDGTAPLVTDRGAGLHRDDRRRRQRNDCRNRIHGTTVVGSPRSTPRTVANPSLIPGAIEETLRYEPPSPVQARYVAHDAEHYGQVVPEGSFMLLLNASANRDEHRFPDPDRFDIHRQGSHLSLGRACTSAWLGAGPAGSSGGPRRGPETLARLGSRLRQRRTGAHRQRARVGTLACLHRLKRLGYVCQSCGYLASFGRFGEE